MWVVVFSLSCSQLFRIEGDYSLKVGIMEISSPVGRQRPLGEGRERRCGVPLPILCWSKLSPWHTYSSLQDGPSSGWQLSLWVWKSGRGQASLQHLRDESLCCGSKLNPNCRDGSCSIPVLPFSRERGWPEVARAEGTSSHPNGTKGTLTTQSRGCRWGHSSTGKMLLLLLGSNSAKAWDRVLSTLAEQQAASSSAEIALGPEWCLRITLLTSHPAHPQPL